VLNRPSRFCKAATALCANPNSASNGGSAWPNWGGSNQAVLDRWFPSAVPTTSVRRTQADLAVAQRVPRSALPTLPHGRPHPRGPNDCVQGERAQ